MANRAAQELQAITQGANQVEDAATALERITPDMPRSGAETPQAEFGTAEAVAAGVLASVIMGPVGAVLVGGAQGWLKKKSDQSLLDRAAAEQSVLSDASDIYTTQLASYRDTATNPNDLEQIDTMQTSLEVAQEFMGSADPALRAKGVQIMNQVDQSMNGYARTQETDRVAAEVQRNADVRQLGLDNYARYENMQTKFDTESAPWLARKEAANIALQALQEGTPAQLHSAMILFNKTLDPNSAVLGEERDAIAGMGSMLDSAYNFFGEKFTGQTLNADQRRELGKAIMTITDESTQFQSQREARYQQRAVEDLAPEYADRFSLIQDTPAADPLDIPDDAKKAIQDAPGLLGERAERVGQFVLEDLESARQDAIEATTGAVGAARDFLANTGEKITETGEDILKRVPTIEGLAVPGIGSRPTN
jgi:hypothetical protein